jgi:DNA-binding PucR family transcriptional regulator
MPEPTTNDLIVASVLEETRVASKAHHRAIALLVETAEAESPVPGLQLETFVRAQALHQLWARARSWTGASALSEADQRLNVPSSPEPALRKLLNTKAPFVLGQDASEMARLVHQHRMAMFHRWHRDLAAILERHTGNGW